MRAARDQYQQSKKPALKASFFDSKPNDGGGKITIRDYANEERETGVVN